MGYKMVFSDMDGTLLWKGVRLSVENYNAIRKVVDKGVDFVICTGRGVFGVEPYLKQLDLIVWLCWTALAIAVVLAALDAMDIFHLFG